MSLKVQNVQPRYIESIQEKHLDKKDKDHEKIMKNKQIRTVKRSCLKLKSVE